MRPIFIRAKEVSTTGHYLERRIQLAKLFDVPQEYIHVMQAFAAFMRERCKPAGIDAFLEDVDALIIIGADQHIPTPEEWQSIVWGVDIDVLKRYGLSRYKPGSIHARGNV